MSERLERRPHSAAGGAVCSEGLPDQVLAVGGFSADFVTGAAQRLAKRRSPGAMERPPTSCCQHCAPQGARGGRLRGDNDMKSCRGGR